MKIYFPFACMLLLCANIAFAQTGVSKPQAFKPVYFDVSPPLRDLVKDADIKADMTWKEGVVKNKLRPQDLVPKYQDTDFIDPIAQRNNGKTVSDTTIVNFDGVGANSGLCPPDTDGDVGPNHYISLVNVKYSIYSKTGGVIMGPVNNSTVWSGMPNNSNDGDGIVLYDEQADRWLFTQFSLPNYPNGPFYMMIAVSQTPDPTGSWYRYQYSFSDMPDYPKFGVWVDGYYMSANRFSSGSTTYKGVGAYAFERDKMLTGDATAQMVTFTLPASNDAWRLLPSDCDSEFPPLGTPCSFAYLNDTPDKIAMYKFSVNWDTTANSTFVAGENIGMTAFDPTIANGIPQKGTSVKLDAMSGTLMNRLPFRKFEDHWSIVGCATVDVGTNHAGIRWFELRKSTPTAPWSKYQEGTYAPDDNCRWMGSISMDADNNIALGYSVSGTDMYPSIRYTGRLNSDPLGEMTIAESGIINGGGSQTNTWSGTPSRWGDYSRMTTDPSQPNTFWYTQEYYASTSQSNWKTRVGSFSFANILGLTSTATPSVICQGDSSQLNAAATGGSGSYTYSWTSEPTGFVSNLQNPVVNPDTTTRYYITVNDGSGSKTDSVDVTVNNPPAIFAGSDTLYCAWQSSFEIEGSGTGIGSVLWTTSGDGSFDNDTLLATSYHPGAGDKSNGSVSLILTAQAAEPCSGEVSDTSVIEIDPCTGIPDPATLKLGIQVNPNPTTGLITLTVNNGNKGAIDVTVIDALGKTILRNSFISSARTSTFPINLTGQPSGVYMVKVMVNTETVSEKVVVK